MSNKVFHINTTFFGEIATIILENGYAYVMVSRLKDEPDVAVIHDLAVHEEKRRKGLGTELLEEACKAAKEMGAKAVRLSVLPDSWVEQWYKKNGFADIGESEPIMGTVHVILEKPLEK